MIDLHLHSTSSDGRFTPAELVEKAAGGKTTCIALTDHDTLSGIGEFLEAGTAAGIVTIPGVELSVEFPRGEMHLLAYAFAPAVLEQTGILQRIRDLRHQRNRQIFKLMQESGIKIDYDSWCSAIDTAVPGRPHMADLLIEMKMAGSRREAFERYLSEGRPFFLPRKNLSLSECLSAIKKAGGISSVAHPLSLQISRGSLSEYIPRWKDDGIDAIETVHPTINRDQSRRLTAEAEAAGLLCSGGSDFHGMPGDKRFFGKTSWGSPIPSDLTIMSRILPPT